MKKQLLISAFTLLSLTFLSTSCSSDDDTTTAPTNNPISTTLAMNSIVIDNSSAVYTFSNLKYFNPSGDQNATQISGNANEDVNVSIQLLITGGIDTGNYSFINDSSWNHRDKKANLAFKNGNESKYSNPGGTLTITKNADESYAISFTNIEHDDTPYGIGSNMIKISGLLSHPKK